MFYSFGNSRIGSTRDLSNVDPVICPEAESRFYVSFYIPDESTSYGFRILYIIDENGAGHAWKNVCLAPGPFATSTYSNNSNCTGVFTGYKETTVNGVSNRDQTTDVGGPYGDNNLMAFKIPRCYHRVCCTFSDPEDHLYDEEGYIIEAIAGMSNIHGEIEKHIVL